MGEGVSGEYNKMRRSSGSGGKALSRAECGGKTRPARAGRAPRPPPWTRQGPTRDTAVRPVAYARLGRRTGRAGKVESAQTLGAG